MPVTYMGGEVSSSKKPDHAYFMLFYIFLKRGVYIKQLVAVHFLNHQTLNRH